MRLVGKNTFFRFAVLAGMILLAGRLFAQVQISKQSLKNTVVALTDPKCSGRESGTEEIGVARRYISRTMEAYGISMKGESHSYGFWYWKGDERVLGVNIVGIIPADSFIENPETIVIGAHYDHLGVLGGRIYPGADNNASGVAAMLEIGKALVSLRNSGFVLKRNILLVAFDAKEQDCLGSQRFLSDQIVDPSSISLMINLDQIGTTLAPPKAAETGGLLPKNYILVLGADKDMQKLFESCSTGNDSLVLDFSYYGNQRIYDLINNMGDQTSFRSYGIPSVLVTSGVHRHTNKTTDTADIINFNALTQRCRFLLKVICTLVN
ncbi:MAG: M28 family peptidase [Bacteroidales bacterium]|nr:M28 family peptidase [Bacteroidales bacterium]